MPSAKTTRGPSRPRRAASGCDSRGRSRRARSDGCHVKASSSVIRMSAMPSPVRSTNRRFGSAQSRTGSERNGRNPAHPASERCAHKTLDRTARRSTRSRIAVAAQIHELLANVVERGGGRPASDGVVQRRTGRRRDWVCRTTPRPARSRRRRSPRRRDRPSGTPCRRCRPEGWRGSPGQRRTAESPRIRRPRAGFV